jgi:sialidase-1
MNLLRNSLSCFLPVGLFVVSLGPAWADVLLEHVDVFTSGTEGYFQFRIPSIARTADGTLHAFAEGRLTSNADPGGTHIDLVYKRSTDGGKTWTPLSILDRHPDTVVDGSGVPTNRTSASNSVAVVDQSNNRLWVFNMRLPDGVASASSSASANDMQTWVRYSDNNGQTWSTAQHITVPEYTDFYPNIGSGIQTNGGRLIVPASARTFDTGATKSFALTSNDHGVTWQAGSLISTPTNEQQVVQLTNGDLFSSTRQKEGATRVHSTSTDNGANWSTTIGITMTRVAAGLERYTQAGVDGATENRILFTLPEGGSYGARSRLSVRSSTDEAQTFGGSRLIYHGPSAYSDMQRLPGTEVGVLWERGPGTSQPNAGNKSITYTVFNDEFLKPGEATGMLASESFNYTGAKVGWANGANGWNSAWSNTATGTGALNSESQAGMAPDGLTHSGIGHEQGGTASVQGQTMARGLGVGIDLNADQTYYLSALVNRQSANGGGANEWLDLALFDTAGTRQALIGARSNESWAIDELGSVQGTASDVLTNSTTYLLVAKLVASNAGVDQLFLKVLADGQSIPASDTGMLWTLTGGTENNSAMLDRIAVSGGTDALWLVDELRVGLDWASVTSAPEPASARLLVLGFAAVTCYQRRAARNNRRSCGAPHLKDVPAGLPR